MRNNSLKKNLFYFISIALILGCSGTDDLKNALSPCELTPHPGNCKAAIRKYYFDQKEKKCKEFIWGGCGGVVPFQTLQECQQCGTSRAE